MAKLTFGIVDADKQPKELTDAINKCDDATLEPGGQLRCYVSDKAAVLLNANMWAFVIIEAEDKEEKKA